LLAAFAFLIGDDLLRLELYRFFFGLPISTALE
jgi:hypothetical protein